MQYPTSNYKQFSVELNLTTTNNKKWLPYQNYETYHALCLNNLVNYIFRLQVA